MKVAVFEFALFGINSYVVYDERSGECVVVDPGMTDDDERRAMDGFIERHGLRVTHVVNTHLHIDHVAGNAYVVDKYGVDVLAHEGDAFLGGRMRQQASQFGLPLDVANVDVVRWLKDGDEILIGDSSLRVLHVPGHSPGGIALYDNEDGFLISGDSLFAGSIGRTDLPGGDYSELVNAVRSKLLELPDATVVYPGHGPATTIGRERRSNPFLS